MKTVFSCQLSLPAAVFLLAAALARAQTPLYDPVLTVTATSCAARETLSFLIQVPYQEPAAVQYKMPAAGENFRLDQAKKARFTQAGQFFTNIELIFTFPEAGTVQLPDAVFSYAKKTFAVPFPPITVLPDLPSLVPSAYWRIGGPSRAPRAGEKIPVDLYVRNAVGILSFAAGLSENALFERNGGIRTDLGSAEDVIAAEEGIAAAHYTLTPLAEGILYVPEAELTVRTADGGERNISAGQQRLKVSGTILKKESVPPAAPAIGNAFRAAKPADGAAESTASTTVKNDADSKKNAEAIAALRKAERKAALPFAVRSERTAFEEEAGIAPGKNEPAAFWLLPLYMCALLGAAAFLTTKLVAKRFYALPAVAALFFLAASLMLHAAAVKPAAVAAGRTLKTVPEQSASTSASLIPGTRVTILARADGWLLVREAQGHTGWITEADVLFITADKERDK